MKKLKYILILSLLLVPVSFVRAANVVTIDADVNIQLDSPSMTLVLSSGSSYSSMTVTASTVAFTISGGGSITLTSNDKYILTNDKQGSVTLTCSSSSSSVYYAVATGGSDQTITFTPGTALCDGGSTSTGSGTSGSGASAGGTTKAKPATGTQTVSKTVSGVDGGSMATTDGKAGIELPAGLASGNVSMNIVPKASSSYSLPSGYSALASQVYDLTLTSGGQELTEFAQAVTLTFGYNNTDVAGLDENSLRVYYWDGAQWILAGGVVDTTANTVTVEVTHFTIFGVFGAKVSDEVAGDLIKLQCPSGADVNHVCKSVYYLGSDNQRYVFPNEITYNSWYADFSDVKIVASDVMASYGIGGNVTIRPGTYLIKITTDPKVYAVEPGGILRWVNSEDTALALYGSDWIYGIVDVADTFFINYDASEAVDNPVSDQHPAGTLIKYADADDVYYVNENGVKRLLSSAGFTANGYRDEFVIETDKSYTDGTTVAGAETALKTTAGP